MTDRLRVFVFLALSFGLWTAACSKKDNPAGPTGTPTGSTSTGGAGGSGTGTVSGKVTAANGTTGIGSVTVSPAASGSPSTTTDPSGAYTLNGLPSGTQSLRARRGNFESVFSVDVRAGQTASAPVAALKAIGRLAFVPGTFDQVENLVRDQLGNPMDQIAATQLGSSATLNQYKMLFLNCGLDEDPADVPATIQALLAWVRAGGTMYASDFALHYVQNMLPADILTTDENTRPESVTATVSDSSLQTFMGSSTAQIVYDLDGWRGLSSISARPRVLLRGSYMAGFPLQTVSNRPLAIVITEGSGRIIYSTFHDDEAISRPPPDQLAVLRYYLYIE